VIIQRALLATATMLALVDGALAATTPEKICRSTLSKTAGKYVRCQQRAQAKLTAKGDIVKFQKAALKCREKYLGTWAKFQTKSKFVGTSCVLPRFQDNAHGTVMDNLTGLVWEKKTEDSTIHGRDNVYSWSASGTLSDGSVFTELLATLNNKDACFADQCDWRLPSRPELEMLLSGLTPCASPPCIDPIFGPTAPVYWSSTTLVPPQPENQGWATRFDGGGHVSSREAKSGLHHVRAVRRGR